MEQIMLFSKFNVQRLQYWPEEGQNQNPPREVEAAQQKHINRENHHCTVRPQRFL
jgi:hypothetical protein